MWPRMCAVWLSLVCVIHAWMLNPTVQRFPTYQVARPSSELFGTDQPVETTSRRSWMRHTISVSVATLPLVARALDMDAFASQQLQTTATKTTTSVEPKMSDDEAMCRFGQPSPQKGEACLRAGRSTAPLKKGGVDAFGQVDRGDFKRCKKTFELINNKWQDEWVCK